MLRPMRDAFERGGYIVKEELDTGGNRVWRVEYPHWHYNQATGQNEPGKEYVGKIATTPIRPRTTSFYGRLGERIFGPGGTPWFYLVGETPTNQTRNSPVGKKAREIAESVRCDSVRDEI